MAVVVTWVMNEGIKPKSGGCNPEWGVGPAGACLSPCDAPPPPACGTRVPRTRSMTEVQGVGGQGSCGLPDRLLGTGTTKN